MQWMPLCLNHAPARETSDREICRISSSGNGVEHALHGLFPHLQLEGGFQNVLQVVSIGRPKRPVPGDIDGRHGHRIGDLQRVILCTAGQETQGIEYAI